jgi:hypothetical protein
VSRRDCGNEEVEEVDAFLAMSEVLKKDADCEAGNARGITPIITTSYNLHTPLWHAEVFETIGHPCEEGIETDGQAQ